MSARLLRILHVAGARPNFVKVAPIMAAVAAWNDCVGTGRPGNSKRVTFAQTLVHTGQHYDPRLSAVFFEELGLPQPQHHLGVGSGSRAAQIALVAERLDPVLRAERPDLVVVVGDVNSTVGAAQCARRLGIAVAHVEAGLRSGDCEMPEEVNRILTDQLADLLFTTEPSALGNLAREGIDVAKVRFVGNTMIDTLDRLLPLALELHPVPRLGLVSGAFCLVTLHRPSNVDDAEQLSRLLAALTKIAARLPLVWPVHPRTRDRLAELRPSHGWDLMHGMQFADPLGYLEFLALQANARLVLTDSGGVQEETTVLGVPCLTLRTSTERPVTIEQGTNRLVDPFDQACIVRAVDDVLETPMPTRVRPELWDGRAAERIVAGIAEWAGNRE